MYYVVEITKTETEARALYAYTDKTRALAKYHDTLGYAMKLDTVEYCLCMIIDGTGNVIACEKYVAE